MDFRQLIKNWHVRASDESLDYFSKFIFEYLSFVAVLKRIRFANENSDMRAIIRLKEDDVKFKYLELLINNTLGTADAWQLIKQELDERPLGSIDEATGQVNSIWYWKCSHIEVPRRTHICEEQGKLRNLQDWENMVEFWHTIRNNLFHGAKDPQDTRDLLFVENGFNTLSPLMNLLLEDVH